MATPLWNLTTLSTTSSEREEYNKSLLVIESSQGLVTSASVNITTPPVTPVEGELVLVGNGATGIFTGFDGYWGVYNAAAGWVLVPPKANLGPFIDDAGGTWVPNGTLDGWVAFALGAVAPSIANPSGVNSLNVGLIGDVVLVGTDPNYLYYDPGGANRFVDLPAPVQNMQVHITILGGSVNTIEIREDGAVATGIVLTDLVGSTYKAVFTHDGVAWNVDVFSKS